MPDKLRYMPRKAPTWTDLFGRTYDYAPYEARPIGDAPIRFEAEGTLALAEASSKLGSVPRLPIAGIATVLYRSESSASSLIEGIGPGPRRILEAEVADETEIDDEAARRVVRNFAALRDAMATRIPPRSEDLLRWHRMLMTGDPRMAPEHVAAFRTTQNWIGGDASGPRNAVFIPPPPEQVPALIDDLLVFCARTDITAVAHAAIAHARFEVIHPFVDGNGRMGRMLFQQLLRRRIDLTSSIPVSVIWSREKERYIESLRAYQEGDVNAWLVFASLSIIRAVDWMTTVAEKIAALLAEFHGRVPTRGRSVTSRLVDDLPEHPIVDTASVAERYGVTAQSAHSALMRLEAAAVLSERSLARRKKGRPRRVFAAHELIDMLA